MKSIDALIITDHFILTNHKEMKKETAIKMLNILYGKAYSEYSKSTINTAIRTVFNSKWTKDEMALAEAVQDQILQGRIKFDI